MKLRVNGMRSRLSLAALLPIVLLIVPSSGRAQIPTALLHERGPLPGAPAGHTVNSLNNTAVNHAGGYAVAVNSSDGVTTLSHVWGDAAGGPGTVLITEATYGVLVQTAFESFYGISNTGQVCYSATGTGGPDGGFDSVWLDGTPIAVEGEPSSVPNTFWSFASRPGVTADGFPYFAGGIRNTVSGTTSNRGLFFGLGAAPVLLGGDLLTGLPFPLSTTATNPDFDYRYSAFGNHYITPVTMLSGSTSNDVAMIVDSAGLMIAGSLVREGTPVPVAAGGTGTENWSAFDFCGITESGDWFFTGNTNVIPNEIIVKNGAIIHREGDMIDGQLIGGDIEGAYMNENGDIAYIWDVSGGTFEALFINDRMVLREEDPVDLDGDGIIDGNTKLRDFTGISSLTVGDRNGMNDVNIYFTADIDTLGTTTSTDDVEGFFCITVRLEEPIAVELAGFELLAVDASRAVRINWSTAAETNHAGFNVYRAEGRDGAPVRLNDDLVRGNGQYAFTDATVLPGTTYTYRLGAVERSGHEDLLAPATIRTPDWLPVTTLLPNAPNPFAGSTEIRFTLGRTGRADLSVFDVSGRLVRSLAEGALEAGDHTCVWDGRDDRGGIAPGGLYFYRLDTPDGTVTRKMLRSVR